MNPHHASSHAAAVPYTGHPSHGQPPPPPPLHHGAGGGHGGPGAQSTLLFRQYLTDLSTSLFSFVLPLLPTTEELATKEEVRVLIERLIKTIEPSSRGRADARADGTDMDLVCLIDNKEAALHASDLVAMIGDLLERETNFEVKPLPKARIPIIKLTLNPSPGLPFGIACDIGFENRLALENTRLLLTYATIDPARVRTLVLFLKVWSKRRKINSPYRGTLSSYGFTLMVLFFLVHVKNPPVLPNLQRIAPLRPMSKEEVTLEGRDVWFFDDTETLRKEWSSANFESIGELLIDFFRYYSHDFQYNNTVISIRAGHLTKESKGWMNDIDVGGLNESARDRNRLCIEDPFETPYNVARTVTKDGLYTIRGEFMRATRILTGRPERAVLALAELCVEREEELARAPRSASPAPKAMPGGRSPFALGGGWRNHMQGSNVDRLSPTLNSLLGPGELDDFGRRPFPAHMASRRGRQSEPGHPRNLSAQELYMANQGLGLDFQLPPSATNRYNGDNNGRGRDHGSRQMEGNFPPGGYNQPPRRAASIADGGPANDHGGPPGTASAPISPVKGNGQVQEQRQYGNGTWSTGPSPRHSHAPRMPMGAYQNGPSGYRRVSNEPTRSVGGVPANNGLQAQRFPIPGYQNQQNVASRRAYSAGPSHHLNAPQNAAGPIGGNGSSNVADNGSPLPAFQPFATSPTQGNAALSNGDRGHGYPSYISPSALLSPTPVVPPSLPMMNPFPAYHQTLQSESPDSQNGGKAQAQGRTVSQTGSRESRGSDREASQRSGGGGSSGHDSDLLAERMERVNLGRNDPIKGNTANIWSGPVPAAGSLTSKSASPTGNGAASRGPSA